MKLIRTSESEESCEDLHIFCIHMQKLPIHFSKIIACLVNEYTKARFMKLIRTRESEESGEHYKNYFKIANTSNSFES